MSVAPFAYRVSPAAEAAGTGFALGGVVGDWLQTVVENWLLPFPRANPALTQMFRDRDRRPVRKLMPWSGEFAGKYLLGALHIWELTRDPRLAETIELIVDEVVAAQGADGYLGPFPSETRLTGDNWDLWGQYHVLYALLRHYQVTGTTRSLEAAARCADLLCATFGPGRARILHGQQMNMGLVHGLALLYRQVPHPEYLATAQWIVADSDAPGGVQFMRAARRGKEFFQFGEAANRWEILHFAQGLAELYWLTGETTYRDAFSHLYDSIRRLDRHNTGGFSTLEKAVGTPYMLAGEDKPDCPAIWQAMIETCCTVAWSALCVDMLRLTGDPTVADELELTLYNSAQGSMHPSGRWWTYSTPMRGWRISSADQIQFQAHPGGPELNCCNANAPRPLGMIRDWAVMTTEGGVALNYYGAGTLTAALPQGGQVRLEQTETDYPREGLLRLRVGLDQPREFTLNLRVPSWSRDTRILTKEGSDPAPPQPGSYYPVRRTWQPGEEVAIAFDFSPRYWTGQEDCAGRLALYRGPLLLAWDQRLTDCDETDLPTLDAGDLDLQPVDRPVDPRPLLLAEVNAGGRRLLLCDFASAGAAGNPYTSWLPAVNADPAHDGPFAPSLESEV